MRITLVFLLFWGSSLGNLWAQSPLVIPNPVVENVYIPWDLEYWNTDSILFAQRDGLIRRASVADGQYRTLYEADSVAELQHAGLMGMELHPQWPDSAAIFITYTYYTSNFDVFLRVERLRYDRSQDSLYPAKTLVEGIPAASTTTGARLLATENGYLYLSTGDINLGAVAQDTQSLNGKILRYHLDGSVPSNNPFAGSPIYTLGHRNPQGLAIAPDGKIYASEHGNFSNDELNLLEAGRNYGWPEVSGFCNGQPACQTLNLADPIYAWSSTIAPCGLAYQERGGQKYLFLTGLVGQALYQLSLNQNGTQIEQVDALLPNQFGRIRDVLATEDGRLFISTTNRDGATPAANDDQIIELFVFPLSTELGPPQGPYEMFLDQGLATVKAERPFGDQHWFAFQNAQGKVLQKVLLPPNQSRHTFSLAPYPAGAYFLTIIHDQLVLQSQAVIHHP